MGIGNYEHNLTHHFEKHTQLKMILELNEQKLYFVSALIAY